MLSLSSGLQYTNVSGDLTISAVNEISDLVGNWDFSDASSLSKTMLWGINGTVSNQVAVVADDDIGTVANKAWYTYDQENTDLGRVMLNFNVTHTPHYKTGGANGKSYAQFDSTDFLAAGSYSWQGTVTGSDLSTCELNYDAMTIFIVAKPSTASTTRCIFELTGLDDDDTNSNTFKMQYAMNGSNHRFRATMVDYSGSDGDWTIYGANQSTSDIDQVNLHTAWIKPAGQNSKIRFNGANSVSGTDNQQTSTNDSNHNDVTSIGIGCDFPANYFGTSGHASHWNEAVYEIVYYNKTLSEPELLAVESYLMNKYGIS